jgi:hypothetical protein
MNTNLSTEAQRFDQIEALRNEIRPNKSYKVKDRAIENLKLTTRIAPVHDHEVKFSFIGFNPTEAEFKTTGTWTAQTETQLRHEHATNPKNKALYELINREQNESEGENE